MVADRLAEWKRQMNKSKKTTISSQKTNRQEQALQDSGSGQTITGNEENQKPQSLRMSHQKDNIKLMGNEKQRL